MKIVKIKFKKNPEYIYLALWEAFFVPFSLIRMARMNSIVCVFHFPYYLSWLMSFED